MAELGTYFSRLRQRPAWRWRGPIVEAGGPTGASAGRLASVGESCEIVDGFGERHLGEVIGFRGNQVLSMPLGSSDGIRFGDPVTALGMIPQIEVGEALIGRVLDALGQPIDGRRRPSLHMAMP